MVGSLLIVVRTAGDLLFNVYVEETCEIFSRTQGKLIQICVEVKNFVDDELLSKVVEITTSPSFLL